VRVFKTLVGQLAQLKVKPEDIAYVGDGSVIIISTPSHTPGHKSLQ
jgi:glyoxylase-like metal-dependent hydrolase (beta-lactamase superfamily II)